MDSCQLSKLPHYKLGRILNLFTLRIGKIQRWRKIKSLTQRKTYGNNFSVFTFSLTTFLTESEHIQLFLPLVNLDDFQASAFNISLMIIMIILYEMLAPTITTN
jgi:hypothetical protein